MNSEMKRYRFSTRDLVTIAILSALGGVMSVYIGYLGNMVNRVVGVPFGAGQFMAGLHLFWIVISWGLIRRTGVGTMTGLLKGVIEMLMGSTHGAVIIGVSMIQGMLFDLTRQEHSQLLMGLVYIVAVELAWIKQ